ncbi:MAG: ISAzo13 family transposase [Nitrospirae bacterium]|nr:ISAzo13 family transposase [Nitrospirota bacterium]
MISQETIDAIRVKYDTLKNEFDERSNRMWAAIEANTLGYGWVAAVSKATGIAESTIRIGRHEIRRGVLNKEKDGTRRVRKKGGGRKLLSKKDEDIIIMLDAMVEPSSRGDPMSPLRWTCKSTRKLAEEITAKGHPVSHAKVGQLLEDLNYSLQSTRKKMEGTSHPDRDAQFRFIYDKVVEFQKQRQPVISVDTKKKELVGKFFNSGRDYQPKGRPDEGYHSIEAWSHYSRVVTMPHYECIKSGVNPNNHG